MPYEVAANNKKFYTLKYDKVFKRVFLEEKDGKYELLEELLKEVLNKDLKIIKLLPTEQTVSTTNERIKRLDCLVEANGKFLNVEVNITYNEATKVRNLCYFTNFYSRHTKSGKAYDLTTEFIHVSFNFTEKDDIPLKREYMIYDKLNKKEYINNFKIIEVNVAKYCKFWYDNNEIEMKKSSLLILLGLDKLEEMEKYQEANNDSKIGEVVKRMKNLNEDEVFIADISAEEDAILLENTYRMLAQKEGREEGLKEGKTFAKLEVAKSLLADNISIDKVSKYTGLSINEIKNLS